MAMDNQEFRKKTTLASKLLRLAIPIILVTIIALLIFVIPLVTLHQIHISVYEGLGVQVKSPETVLLTYFSKLLPHSYPHGVYTLEVIARDGVTGQNVSIQFLRNIPPGDYIVLIQNVSSAPKWYNLDVIVSSTVPDSHNIISADYFYGGAQF